MLKPPLRPEAPKPTNRLSRTITLVGFDLPRGREPGETSTDDRHVDPNITDERLADDRWWLIGLPE
jgi:hypothetical protein